MQTDAILLANNSQHCWMLHIAFICIPLHVVLCCCTKAKTPYISFVPWSLKCSATMLDPFAQLSQHCWGHAHAFHVVYKVLWVVSFPQCTVGPTLLGVAFAHHCQHWCNNSQNLRIINFSALHVDAIYYNGDNIFNFCPQNLLVKTKTKPAEPP